MFAAILDASMVRKPILKPQTYGGKALVLLQSRRIQTAWIARSVDGDCSIVFGNRVGIVVRPKHRLEREGRLQQRSAAHASVFRDDRIPLEVVGAQIRLFPVSFGWHANRQVGFLIALIKELGCFGGIFWN